MAYLYNNLKLKIFRRKLREEQTDCERILWIKLRNKQCNGLRFLRQYSISPYILDFYCPRLRLAIELDGGQHNEVAQKIYDQKRTEFLSRQNIKILRFWDNEVLENLDGVYAKILEHCL